MTGVSAKGFDGEHSEHFARIGFIPFIYIDFLAVQTQHQGQQIGTGLMVNALRRCTFIASNVAIYGVALNSLNDRTTAFYRGLHFGEKSAKGMQHPLMVLPVWTLLDAATITA